MQKFSNTYKHMNKPLYFKGFSPLQLAGLVGFNFFGFILFGIAIGIKPFLFILFAILVYGSIKIGQKIYSENQKGCPDYVQSYMIEMEAKSYFVDKNKFFDRL